VVTRSQLNGFMVSKSGLCNECHPADIIVGQRISMSPRKIRQFGTQPGGIGMGITGSLILGGTSITGVTTCDTGTLTLTG